MQGLARTEARGSHGKCQSVKWWGGERRNVRVCRSVLVIMNTKRPTVHFCICSLLVPSCCSSSLLASLRVVLFPLYISVSFICPSFSMLPQIIPLIFPPPVLFAIFAHTLLFCFYRIYPTALATNSSFQGHCRLRNGRLQRFNIGRSEKTLRQHDSPQRPCTRRPSAQHFYQLRHLQDQ